MARHDDRQPLAAMSVKPGRADGRSFRNLFLMPDPHDFGRALQCARQLVLTLLSTPRSARPLSLAPRLTRTFRNLFLTPHAHSSGRALCRARPLFLSLLPTLTRARQLSLSLLSLTSLPLLLLFTLSPSLAHAQANPTVGGGGGCPDGAAFTPGGYAQIPVNDGIYTCSSGAWAPEALVIGSVLQSGAAPTCSSSTAGMLYYTGGTVEYCNGTSFTTFGGGLVLSSVTAASAANTIANGTNAQVWNWALGATTNTGITFGETTKATAASKIVDITTLASSTAVPLTITNGGSSAFAINMSAGGLAIGGTNVIDLPDADSTSIAVGENALADQNAINEYNVAVGNGALNDNTSATTNTAVGQSAAGLTTSGGGNTAIGQTALYSNTTGSSNVAVGGGPI